MKNLRTKQELIDLWDKGGYKYSTPMELWITDREFLVQIVAHIRGDVMGLDPIAALQKVLKPDETT